MYTVTVGDWSQVCQMGSQTAATPPDIQMVQAKQRGSELEANRTMRVINIFLPLKLLQRSYRPIRFNGFDLTNISVSAAALVKKNPTRNTGLDPTAANTCRLLKNMMIITVRQGEKYDWLSET